MRNWLNNIRSLHHRALSINERNLRLVYPLNKRKFFHLANDKVETKRILEEHGIPTAQSLAVISKMGEIHSKWRTVEKDCAIKPANGSGGGGILVLSREGESWIKSGATMSDDLIERHIGNIIFGVYSFGNGDAALIEEKIDPHSVFLAIYPDGVPDLRLIVKEGQILMGMMRIPTAASDGKANLHQGALGVALNLESGVLGQAFDGKQYMDIHPDNGQAITGTEVPDWGGVLKIAHQVDNAFPLGYLGIDIAFDEVKGPLVLEINVRPGLEIQNVNKQGIKDLLS